MPNELGSSIAPSNGPSSGDGPKYNEDVVALEEEVETPDGEEEEEEEQESSDDQEEKIDDKEDEEEEDEEKEEEDKEEDLEDENKLPFSRPSIKEIKAKYPEFFKDFPELKESYFREIEFTKLFPTVEDAKEAFQENEAFTALSDSALEGNPAPILDSLEKTDKKALETFALSFLPTLFNKNKDLYTEVATPILQNLIRMVYSEKDEDSQKAAILVSKFVFGADGEDIAKGAKTSVRNIEPTEDQKKIRETREAKLNTDFRASVGKVEARVSSAITKMVMKNELFDPNGVFSPFLKKQGAQEVVRRISQQLMKDQGHMTVMAARWKRARANGFTSDDESKIVSTYLARAKSLIPDACSKVSAAMLGTKVKAADNKRGQVKTFRRENNSGREVSGKRNGSSQNVDYGKMSDMDILNMD